ncbi:MAG: peroxidase family protein [Cyanobacteria bacterium J06600_6]
MVDINDIRTIDGSDNQIDEDGESLGGERDNGSTGAALIRLFEPAFEDGINEPRGGGDPEASSLPNTRTISNELSDQDGVTGNPLNASDWLWQWGQFLDHDLGLSEGTNILTINNEEDRAEAVFDVPLPAGDRLIGANFTAIPVSRVPAEPGTGEGEEVREVGNEVTAFIDGSNGYGSDIIRAAAKRSDLGNSFFGRFSEGTVKIEESTGRRFVEAEIEEGDNLELVGTEGEEVEENELVKVYLPPQNESPFDGKLLVANDEYGTDGLPFESGSDPTNTSDEILAPYNRADSANADPDPDPESSTEGRVPNDQEFISGDVRINEQSGLIAIHTLFIREHNLIADKVAFHLDARDNEDFNELFAAFRDEYVPSLGLEEEPSALEIRSEFIYEASRAVVGAKNQVITYEEFLPLLIGNEGADDLEVIDEDILSPGISVEFSGAAYRLGHTLLSNQIRTVDTEGVGSISLRDAFFNPQAISANGLDDILIGLNYQQSNDADTRVIDGVRNNLFGPPGAGGLDLVAINLQRGRELGIPGYVEVYNQLNPEATIESFEDLEPIFGEELAGKFESSYDNVEDIDLWIGGLAEMPIQEDVLLGPTLGAIVADQFARLRDYDRFFYKEQLANEESFLSVVAETIGLDLGNVRLADIIRENVGDPELVPDDAFTVPFENEMLGTVNSDRNNRQLVGTDEADLIDGLSGDDLILGGLGHDIIFGGKGNDTLRGQAGTDTLVGGEGNDLLESAAGDVFNGGTGSDTYDVILVPGPVGTQIIDEGGSNDVLTFDLRDSDPITIALADYAPGITGIKRSGNNLFVDFNQNGIVDFEDDLSIRNYFDAEGEAGIGAIESLGNLASEDIVEYFSAESITDGSDVFRLNDRQADLFRYTRSASERDELIDDGFEDDGVAFTTAPEDDDLDSFTGAKPVYLFANEDTSAHLFTLSEVERDAVLENLDNLSFEGTAFYAYATERPGTEAVYRFLNLENGTHFYTTSASERADLLDDDDFRPEGNDGIAFYVPEADV